MGAFLEDGHSSFKIQLDTFTIIPVYNDYICAVSNVCREMTECIYNIVMSSNGFVPFVLLIDQHQH